MENHSLIVSKTSYILLSSIKDVYQNQYLRDDLLSYISRSEMATANILQKFANCSSFKQPIKARILSVEQKMKSRSTKDHKKMSFKFAETVPIKSLQLIIEDFAVNNRRQYGASCSKHCLPNKVVRSIRSVYANHIIEYTFVL